MTDTPTVETPDAATPIQPEVAEAPTAPTPAAEASSATPSFSDAAAMLPKAVEIFESGPGSEGYDDAYALLDAAGWLEDPADTDDQDVAEFNPDDYDDPVEARIAQLEANLSERDKRDEQRQADAASQAAWSAFESDMAAAGIEGIDQDMTKWDDNQNILGGLGLHLGDVSKAQEMLSARDEKIKTEAIKDFLAGKSDVKLPPETSRNGTEVADDGLPPRAAISAAATRIIHGQQ